MKTTTVSFNGNELVIEGNTIGQRIRKNNLLRLLRVSDIKDEERMLQAQYAVIYLSHIKSGDFGLDLPLSNAPQSEIEAFIEAFISLDEALLDLIDEGVLNTRIASNDNELLPPEAVSETKKKTNE